MVTGNREKKDTKSRADLQLSLIKHLQHLQRKNVIEPLQKEREIMCIII